MKKLVLILAALFIGNAILQAKPVDVRKAQSAAQKLATAQLALDRSMPNLVYTGQNESFFVFNLGTNAFVIIAGDDAYRPVIGYSDESAFDASNIPPALADYLDGIAESILRLRSRGDSVATPLVAVEWESVLTHGRLISRNGGRANTYMVQTKWNQDYPYNYYCPTGAGGPGGHVRRDRADDPFRHAGADMHVSHRTCVWTVRRRIQTGRLVPPRPQGSGPGADRRHPESCAVSGRPRAAGAPECPFTVHCPMTLIPGGGCMENDYGLSPGDRIQVTWGKDRKHTVQSVTVVKEYPRFIRVDVGQYRSTINKADLITGDLSIKRIGGNANDNR